MRMRNGLGDNLPVNGRGAAVKRLNSIKEHQSSMVKDFQESWQGWLTSVAVHALVFVVLALIVYPVAATLPGIVLAVLEEDDGIFDENIDDFLTDSPVISDSTEPPSVEADRVDDKVGYNELVDAGAPDWMTSGGDLAGFGKAGGGTDRPGGGKGFWGDVGIYRKNGLDIVFVFDSTGSMGGIILEVKTRIRQLMKVVKYIVPNARLGLVTYRDRPKYDLDDFEYTVKYIKLTRGTDEGMQKLSKFLRETEAYGGGDIPEAVYDGVNTAIRKSGWSQKAKKIIIVFGDAPPRPESNGLSKINNLCANWHKRTGGVVSCIDTTGSSKLLSEFKAMAENGGGESSFLNDERAIIKQLVVLIFGKKWKTEIEDIYKTVLTQPAVETVEVK